MNPIDPIDRWLGAANFELLDREKPLDADHANDDPWADAVGHPPPLSSEQRSFVSDTSPAFGAAVTPTTLTGEVPFSSLSDHAIDQADNDVISFDDDV